MSKETREFTLDKNIIWSIIKSQAGSLQKAVTELLMNAIDAEATSVTVDIGSKAIRVRDDGHGFVDRESIEQWFEKFGTPHVDGDARYGKFRIGRGQIMTFGANHWRSGLFSMSVDIKAKGIEYDLTTHPDHAPGCTIDITLYDALSPGEVLQTIDQLADAAKFAPIPVIVNGRNVADGIATTKWTLIDDDAYYLVSAGRSSLRAYNLGIFVRDFYSSENGTGGIVVSRRTLQVNFARNDLLARECAVWKRITAVLKGFASKERKKPVQTDQYRRMMMASLLSGTCDFETIFDEKLFTDVSGKHYTLARLTEAVNDTGVLVSVADVTPSADRAHQSKLAVVLSPKTLERADWRPIEDIFDRIENNVRGAASLLSEWQVNAVLRRVAHLRSRLRPLEDVVPILDSEFSPVDSKKLSKSELCVLDAVADCNSLLARMAEVPPRIVAAMESESIDGVTNGRDHIWINRKLLKVPGYAGAAFVRFHEIAMLMIHEYVHDSEDTTAHGHPGEFYERYHAITAAPNAGYAVINMVQSWIRIRRRRSLKTTKCDLDLLDLLATAPANEQDPAQIASTTPPSDTTTATRAMERPDFALS
jgi:hypothetical protein